MADIYFKCACGKSLAIDEAGAGRMVKCVDCGLRIEAPEPEMEFECEYCRVTLLAPFVAADDRIVCMNCGRRITVPCPPPPGGGCADACPESDVETAETSDNARPERRGRAMRLGILAVLLAVAGFMARRYVGSPGRPAMPEPPVSRSVSPALAESTACQAPYDLSREEELPSMQENPGLRPRGFGMEHAVDRRDAGGEPAILGAGAGKTPGLGDYRPAPDPAADDAAVPESRAAAAADSEPDRAAHDVVERCLRIHEKRGSTRDEWKEYARQLRLLRKELLDYVRAHAGEDSIDNRWPIAFDQVYRQTLQDDCRDYADAERLTREAMSVLLDSGAGNSFPAARTAISVFAVFAYGWMDEEPGKAAAFLDEMEQVFLDAQNARMVREHWYFQTGYLHGNFFLMQYRVPEAGRAGYARRRAESVRTLMEDEGISLKRRTRAMAYWAYYALFQTGHTAEAAALLREWWARHGGKIDEIDFYRNWMIVELLGNGDWDLAWTILNEAVARKEAWRTKYCLQAFDDMIETYYNNFFLPGYELQRRQRMKQREVLEKQALAASG